MRQIFLKKLKLVLDFSVFFRRVTSQDITLSYFKRVFFFMSRPAALFIFIFYTQASDLAGHNTLLILRGRFSLCPDRQFQSNKFPPMHFRTRVGLIHTILFFIALFSQVLCNFHCVHDINFSVFIEV